MKIAAWLIGAIALVAAVAGLARLRAENDRLTARVAELEEDNGALRSVEVVAPSPSLGEEARATRNFDVLRARAEKAETLADEMATLNAELTQRINTRPDDLEAKKAAISRKGKGAGKRSAEELALIAEAKRVFGAVDAEKETQRRYGAFLSALDPSDAEAARNTLSALLATSKRGGNDFRQRVRDAMAAVLSSEELEAFNRYEDELPEAMMRQDYDQDIALLAPELGLESRNLVVDTLIGDILDARNGIAEGDDYGRLANMIESMYGTRDSLVELLPEDELSAATRYLDIRIAMMEAKLPFVDAPVGVKPKMAAS